MELQVSNFRLAHTLNSGQFFRYQKVGDWYYCQERNFCFKIRQQKDVLIFEGTTKAHIHQLFGLNRAQDRASDVLVNDSTLLPMINKYGGLRVMRRDPWETLVSFQCSILSNIPKIKKNVELIAQTFGKEQEFEGKSCYAFPNPGEINDFEKIRQCATGFRTRYIHAANALVDDSFFARLRKKKYESARKKLMELPGVAQKVADCVCLFGLGKSEAFPVDVWMERVMQEVYFNNKKVKHDEIRDFAHNRWGKNAGYAQQYLYQWIRNR